MTPIHIMTDLEAKTLDVYNITQSLHSINGDIALLTRLKAAEVKQVELTASLALAQEALAVAQACDRKAKQIELYGKFGKVDIAAVAREHTNGQALGYSYHLTYEIMEYDGRSTQFVTKKAIGFGSLPHGLYEYIVNVMPHKLPSVLLKLASDPATAMAVYHKALAQGYIAG